HSDASHYLYLMTASHCLPLHSLRHYLCRIGGAFALAFESNVARTRPSDDVALHVLNRDDGVVERGENVRDAVVNVFAALRLDDLRLLDAFRTKGKVLRRRRGRSSRFLFLCLRRGLFLRLSRSYNRRDFHLGRLALDFCCVGFGPSVFRSFGRPRFLFGVFRRFLWFSH